MAQISEFPTVKPEIIDLIPISQDGDTCSVLVYDLITLITTDIMKEISDKTYYVNPNIGIDINDGLTAETAFKTFEKTISVIPKVVNSNYIIQCAPGTYDSLNINGFEGVGKISVLGNGTVMLDGFSIANNSCKIYIRGI